MFETKTSENIVLCNHKHKKEDTSYPNSSPRLIQIIRTFVTKWCRLKPLT